MASVGERRTAQGRPPRRRARGRILALAAVLVAVVGVGAAAVLLFRDEAAEPSPREALAPFLAAWSRGDDRGAARLTDRPREAERVLVANRKGLDGASVRATVVRLATPPEGA